PTSASGAVCSAASKSWKPPFATISISTMKTPSPSAGHEPPIRSWIASPATLSARPLLPLLDLSHEPLGQETSSAQTPKEDRACAPRYLTLLDLPTCRFRADIVHSHIPALITEP